MLAQTVMAPETSGGFAASVCRHVALVVPDLALRLMEAEHPDWRTQAWCLVRGTGNGERVVSVSPAAGELGLRPGTAVAQVRRAFPGLPMREADPRLLSRWRRVVSALCDARTPEWELDDDGSARLDLEPVAELVGSDLASWMRLLRDDLVRATGVSEGLRLAAASTRAAARVLAACRAGREPLLPSDAEQEARWVGSARLEELPWIPSGVRERLARYGLRSLGEIRRFPRGALRLQFGDDGERLSALAHGLDTGREERSGRRVAEDIVLDGRDEPDLRQHLHELSERLSFALRERGVRPRELQLSVAWADGEEWTRSGCWEAGIEGFLSLREAAWSLLAALPSRSIRPRTLRLSASRTCPADLQQDLFAAAEPEPAALATIDPERLRLGYAGLRAALSVSLPRACRRAA